MMSADHRNNRQDNGSPSVSWEERCKQAEEERVEQLMHHQWDLIGRSVMNHESEEKSWKHISRQTVGRRRHRMFAIVWRSLAVASVLLLVVMGTWRLTDRKQPAPSLVAEVERTYYAVQNETFVLPDSSVVWMKAGSTLKYSSNYLADRRVRLSGESVFDVKKCEGVPFRVYTGESFVEVKGTVFQVISRDETQESEVTLYRGAVDFTTSSGGQCIEMKPGQRISYCASTDKIELKSVEMIEWDNGRYHFTDRSLDELVACISNLYHVEVKPARDLSRHHRFNGYIRYDESLESVLDKICYNASLRYKKRDNIYVIYK